MINYINFNNHGVYYSPIKKVLETYNVSLMLDNLKYR